MAWAGVWRWVLGLVVGLLGWVGPGQATETLSGLPASGTIRWVTYNVAGFNGWHRRQDDFEAQRSRAEEMGAAMRAWDATVIGLQELPREPELQAALRRGFGAGWMVQPLPINAAPHTLRTVGLAWRSDRVDRVEVAKAESGWPRYWGAADVRIDGQPWRVHTGKLYPGANETANQRRREEVPRLLSELSQDRDVQSEHVIVLADLNMDAGDPLFERWWQAGWRDAAAHDQPTKHDRGEPTYRRRLDYVFLPVDLSAVILRGEVLTAGRFKWRPTVDSEAWSDHLPVLVDLRLSGGRAGADSP